MMAALSAERSDGDVSAWPAALLASHFARPADRAGLVRLSELARTGHPYTAWLALEERGLSGADRRTQAAFFLGGVSWVLCILACTAALEGLAMPDTPDAIAVVPESYAWQHEDRSGESVRYRFDFEPARASAWSGGPEAVAAGLTRLFAPLVEGLKAEVNLSRNALWRMISDSVAGGFLAAGRDLGREDEAIALGQAIVSDLRFPLANGRTGYVRIGVSEDLDAGPSTMFAVRGGCCRYYTVPQGSVCAKCVLRSPAERDGLLREWYRKQVLGPLAESAG